MEYIINPVSTLREYILTMYENYIIGDKEDLRIIEVYPILYDSDDKPEKPIWLIGNYVNRENLYDEIVKEMNKYPGRYSNLISKYLNRDINYKTIKITPYYGQDRTLLLIDNRGLPIVIDNMYRLALFLNTALYKKAITSTIIEFNRNIKVLTRNLIDYGLENNMYVDNSILEQIKSNPSVCYKGVLNYRLTVFNY